MRRSITTFPSLLCLLALGCSGTSTGNPFDGSGGNDDLEGGGLDAQDGATAGEGDFSGRGCIDEPRVIDVDEATPLGFSAADILAFVEGEHGETVQWGMPLQVTVEPEQGQGEITIGVAHAGGEVRFVDSVDDPDFALDIVTVCQGRLEIDVTITLQTAGGALDETLDATLVVRSELLARASARLEIDDLGGALTITPEEPGWTVGTMDLQLDFTPFGASGTLQVFLEMHTEGADSESAAIGGTTGGGGALLSWGGAGDCEYGQVAVGQNDEVLDTRAADLAAALGAVQSATVTWADASTATATLGFTAGEHACVHLEGGFGDDGQGLSFDATLAITTDDGTVDGSWPVVAYAPLGGGGPERVTLAADWERLRSQATASMPFGVSGLDTDGYDDFSLDLELIYALGDDGATLTGDFNVLGFLPPDCDPAVEYDDEGNVIATGGCPGSEDVTLLRGEIAGP